MSDITLDQQIAEVRRELAMREKLYPKWVSEKRLKPEAAERCLNAMKAVLATLNNIKESNGA